MQSSRTPAPKTIHNTDEASKEKSEEQRLDREFLVVPTGQGGQYDLIHGIVLVDIPKGPVVLWSAATLPPEAILCAQAYGTRKVQPFCSWNWMQINFSYTP
jgi:hypothetical protein